ncbi:VOC family protein [Nonomuraea sp. B19D2]|uniref:VOC family protein n=1 Tax=Nonomuraea sp. B19D2 TaxID=3159561 RepID=UPI0032DACD3E
MHRSRVYALLVDTPAAEAEQAAAFWSGALGATASPLPGYEQFTSLHGAVPGLAVAVQAVDDAPRFHIDIETDDVEAETRRSPRRPRRSGPGHPSRRCSPLRGARAGARRSAWRTWAS